MCLGMAATWGHPPRVAQMSHAADLSPLLFLSQSSVCSKIVQLLGQNEVDYRQKQVVIVSQDSFYRVLTSEQKSKALKGQFNFDHPGEWRTARGLCHAVGGEGWRRDPQFHQQRALGGLVKLLWSWVLPWQGAGGHLCPLQYNLCLSWERNCLWGGVCDEKGQVAPSDPLRCSSCPCKNISQFENLSGAAVLGPGSSVLAQPPGASSSVSPLQGGSRLVKLLCKPLH